VPVLFVRVKDPETGHEFDVLEGSILLRRELVKLVKAKRYPPSPIRRAPKHHIDLAGQSVTQEDAEQQGAASAANTPEEN
jgi:hypothetical protein